MFLTYKENRKGAVVMRKGFLILYVYDKTREYLLIHLSWYCTRSRKNFPFLFNSVPLFHIYIRYDGAYGACVMCNVYGTNILYRIKCVRIEYFRTLKLWFSYNECNYDTFMYVHAFYLELERLPKITQFLKLWQIKLVISLSPVFVCATDINN